MVRARVKSRPPAVRGIISMRQLGKELSIKSRGLPRMSLCLRQGGEILEQYFLSQHISISELTAVQLYLSDVLPFFILPSS